ncbi:hypothetical protein EDB92DRAFT_1833448 [Lactarius akahatsu]|uniref:DUF7719 domain-containing protein n=1 Tax=Lactarius akahatsu TaxID=416441 RepID=A0AAD4LQW4_9AGAM|nr:hypothetical protein EDB92DRAFT_1833448 [Lactarius akahatsu]
MAKRHRGTHTRQSPPGVQISEEEQLRLIEQTGILKEIPASGQRHEASSATPRADVDDDDDYPLAEEIFVATTLLIPMSFLLLMMYILVHFQYGQQPSWDIITNRMLSSVPILAIFIFYTNRYKHRRWAQAGFFILSVLSGTRMIYQVNYSNWLLNMQQCPPIGTIWVYTVLQLDLGPAALALSTVAVWVWWTGARLVFN